MKQNKQLSNSKKPNNYIATKIDDSRGIDLRGNAEDI